MPSHKMSLPPNVDQTDATGSAAEALRQQLSHPTMQLPPNTMMVPRQHFTIALWFSIYVGETDVSYMCGQ